MRIWVNALISYQFINIFRIHERNVKWHSVKDMLNHLSIQVKFRSYGRLMRVLEYPQKLGQGRPYRKRANEFNFCKGRANLMVHH
jgi:hypothetical protein